MPVLGLSIFEIEALWETDRHWIYRALALNEAQSLAVPIRQQHERQLAKERAAAAAEAERAAIRESKRELWRNRQERKAPRETVTNEG